MKNKNINYGLLTDTQVLAPEIRQNFNLDYEVKDASFARGRFAQVRRCIHKTELNECAAKVMRKYRRAVDVTNEIMHEVRVLLMADKERHIVNLLQLYETTSEFILVLEMADGGELQHVLDEYDNIPEANTKLMLRQLMNAVIFLHNNNIAHLDIKPQNILLTKPYPEGEVKLCDFGISRLITNDTELREIIGTADYVAPEILHYEPIFLTTDMWSIGVLVYVMLSGYLPYTGETKQETYLNITQGTLDFPSDLFNGISESAIDFICKLLKKKPKQRLNSLECLEHKWFNEEINEQKIEQIQQINELNNCNNDKLISTNQSINHELLINNNLDNLKKIEQNLIIKNDQIENIQILNENKNDLNTNGTTNCCQQQKDNKQINENCKKETTELNDKNNLNELDNKTLLKENNENQLKLLKEDKLKSDNLNNNSNNSNNEIINTITTTNTNELITTKCTNVTLLTAN